MIMRRQLENARKEAYAVWKDAKEHGDRKGAWHAQGRLDEIDGLIKLCG